MVKKLLKYDLKAYFRVLAPAYVVLLSIALVLRLMQCFEPTPVPGDSMVPTQVYEVLFISLVVLLVLACLTVLIITFAQTILVFYRNLFTREGYLSFTLPVSTKQHLKAKTLGAVIVSVTSTLVCLLAGVIATLGEMLVEVWKAFWYLVGEVVEEAGAAHMTFWAIEGVVLVFAALVASYLFYCLCITLGQQAKKNRVLSAFGVFFIFYLAAQLFATLLVILVAVDAMWFVDFIEWIIDLHYTGIHLVLIAGIVFNILFAVIAWCVNRNLITSRLNLE